MNQPFGFTGYIADELDMTGTLFAQAREYMPNVGRFVSEDLIKGFVEAPFTLNQYGYCWNKPLKYVDLNGMHPYDVDAVSGAAPSFDHNRHIIFVHGTVLRSDDREAELGRTHWNSTSGHIMAELGIPNQHIPYWVGDNTTTERQTGGDIVANYIRNILRDNPNAEILILGYSHGGNVAKIALNNLIMENIIHNIFNTGYELNLSNITLVGTGTPALYSYQLNNLTQSSLKHHFNFYNNWDLVQRLYALRGSSGRRVNLDGHEIGRAQHGATNISVETGVTRGWRNNWGLNEAHSSMVTSIEMWDIYKIAPIRDSKGW